MISQEHLNPREFRRLQTEFDFVNVEGLRYLVDTKGLPLFEGESRVYPYHDEGADLLRVAQSLPTEFDTVVDAFAGGGHSLLPIVSAGIGRHGYGIDLNPRAIKLAAINAGINGLGHRVHFEVGDIRDRLPRFSGRTLYIANPPFALPAQGVEMDQMRDGGHDGLRLTLTYINVVTTDDYVEETLRGAQPGDFIIGLAYSRIGTNGSIELQDELAKLVDGHSRFDLKLVEGRALWRSANGRKEQPNPMQLDRMEVKAVPGPDYARQVAEYQVATSVH